MHNLFEKDVYSELLKERIIFIDKEITSDTASSIVAKLLYLDSLSQEDILVYINSPGGSVSDGLMIYDTIKLIKSDVQTIALGTAASMASILLISGTKGKRKILPHAKVMLHDIYCGAEGKYSDVVVAAKEMKRSHDILFRIIKENTLLTDEEIKNNLKHDYWFDSENALRLSVIDEIVENK